MTTLTLPRRANAPILDGYVAYVEPILQKLLDTLGNGTAQGVTSETLSGLGPPPLSSGEMQASYKITQVQATLFRTELNSLDANIADIAQKSAELSGNTTTEVTALVETIRERLTSVPENPSIQDQFNAIADIDGDVSKAEQAVTQALDQNNTHSDAVAQNSPATDSASPASYSGGSPESASPSSYVPTDSSGGYSSQYTAPVNSSGGTGQHHTLSKAEIDDYIKQALHQLGINDPVSIANWTKGYEVLIARESGGDIGAINTTDSNAAAGHPSQGLTQTIPGTFNKYHVAGTSSIITNPVANIASSVDYVMDVYHVSRDGSNLAANVQQADPSRSAKGY
ncbi:hypothetical protein [Nocardia sp. NBC_01327]|uniref:hypothetical protein n=1 Tax=Nocardia sp. NBC_01327 TaxID=2903593 RepID=UPI002E156837|nr:hypothetical protein OG326_41980 [Nocardia sp. NBC_01327]